MDRKKERCSAMNDEGTLCTERRGELSQAEIDFRRRRRMTNRPRAAPATAAQKAEESRQAIVLLVIVMLFLICHTLR